jgi:hypothetical protein
MTTNSTTYPSDSMFETLANAVRVDNVMKSDKEKMLSVLRDILPFNTAPALPLNTPNGTIIQDTFEHYLATTSHYSTGSIVKLALGDPLDFEWDIKEGVKTELEKFKDRSYFDLGRFLHLAVLEPEKWNSVIAEPKSSRSTLDGCDTLITFWEAMHAARAVPFAKDNPIKIDEKRKYIDYLKSNLGLPCIDGQQALIINTLFERWKSYQNGLWADLIGKAHKEVSMYATNYRGLPMRVRPDGLLFENQIGVNTIVSVKTTSAPTLRQYRNQCATLGYNMKEAAYQDIVSHITGEEFRNTIMVVFQTVEPFHVGVFHFNHTDIDIARHTFNDALQEANELLRHGVFPGWEESALMGDCGLIDLKMPEWANNTE